MTSNRPAKWDIGVLHGFRAIMVLLVANFLSALGSVTLGDVLYGMLVIVSSPMVCSGYWVLSLFLWACLLMSSLSQLKKLKQEK